MVIRKSELIGSLPIARSSTKRTQLLMLGFEYRLVPFMDCLNFARWGAKVEMSCNGLLYRVWQTYLHG